MLTTIQLRNFRCFGSLAVEFSPGTNLICGANAQGKTSILEAVCAILRLQSPRSSTLTRAIRHEAKGFVLDGFFRSVHLQFYFGRERKKLALDSVEQKTSAAWLELGRVVYFANPDTAIVRGPAEHRRAFLNFVAPQLRPQYRHDMRAFEKALRSRNHLLRAPHPSWREISAFNQPLADAGQRIIDARRSLIMALQLSVPAAMRAISSRAEELRVEYLCGCDGNLHEALAASRDEDLRLRTTTLGPHRDDLAFFVNDSAIEFASEGQQRSIALALKLGQAAALAGHAGKFPLLLIDDVFGELDFNRRNALLEALPTDAQKIITTTNADWLSGQRIDLEYHLEAGRLL